MYAANEKPLHLSKTKKPLTECFEKSPCLARVFHFDRYTYYNNIITFSYDIL